MRSPLREKNPLVLSALVAPHPINTAHAPTRILSYYSTRHTQCAAAVACISQRRAGKGTAEVSLRGAAAAAASTSSKMPPANDAALSVVKSYNLNPRIQVRGPKQGRCCPRKAGGVDGW